MSAAQKTKEVSIFLSPEVRSVLSENQTDVSEILRHEGLNFETRLATPRGSVGQKDAALILIATAAVIASATPILSRALEALSNKRPKIEKHKIGATGLGISLQFETERSN